MAPFRTFKVSPAMTSGTPAQAITRLDAGTIIDFSRTTMKNTSEEYLSNFSIQTVDAVAQQGTDIEITDPSLIAQGSVSGEITPFLKNPNDDINSKNFNVCSPPF